MIADSSENIYPLESRFCLNFSIEVLLLSIQAHNYFTHSRDSYLKRQGQFSIT